MRDARARSRRSSALAAVLFAAPASIAAVGCLAAPDSPSDAALDAAREAASDLASTPGVQVVETQRELLAPGIAHFTLIVRIDGAADLAVHRVVRELSPGIARPTGSAAMLLHGDFATFTSNFVIPSAVPAASATPESRGLAAYLAARGVDVWGVDRRWTRTPADASDFSDYAATGLSDVLEDTRRALAFARKVRASSGAGHDRLTLVGFSHGAEIAYEYAGVESQRPLGLRHVKALVPLDVYDRIAPEDEDLRQAACASRDDELAFVADGYLAGENGFFSLMGVLAETAPSDASPIFPSRDNRDALLNFLGRTFVFYAATPDYHLAGGVVAGTTVSSLRFSAEIRVEDWFSQAPPFQSMIEGADLDAVWCNDGARPVPDHLADVEVPVFYVGAAGGFGDHGLYTTTLLGSSDVTTLVVRRLDASQEAEDFGHADLLYATDAPTLVWEPVADWVLAH